MKSTILGETLENQDATANKDRWRGLLRAIPLPLRTRFVALHHKALGPFDEDETGQFEMEFDLPYSAVKKDLDSKHRNVVLDVLNRTRDWGYQIDHRVNEYILLELFKSRKERLPLSIRVAFVAIYHKILGPLEEKEEVAEFEKQFALSYEKTKAELNATIRKKILDILGRTNTWAKWVRNQVDDHIKG